MKTSCIFCKLVSQEIPAKVVYEDDLFLSFLDINPIVKGHTLVIPKTHYNLMTDTPDEILSRGICLVKRIAKAQRAGLHAEGANIIQNNGETSGQVVPHLHFHVIPRFKTDDHRWNWAAKSYENDAELIDHCEKIKNAI